MIDVVLTQSIHQVMWEYVFLLPFGMSMCVEGGDDTGSKGSEYFVVAFPQNLETPSLQLLVSTRELEPVPFLVETLGDFQFSGVVNNVTAVIVQLNDTFKVTNNTERSKGIKITAGDKQLVVYGMSYYWESSDVFSALPCSKQNISEYVYYGVTFAAKRISNLSSQLLFVACEDDTTIIVNSQYIILDRMETYLYKDEQNLTGTRVVANKPISFFSGHQCNNIPSEVGGCDHLLEQLPNTALWGKHFLSASLYERNTVNVYNLVSFTLSTIVTFACSNQTDSFLTTHSQFSNNTERVIVPDNTFCAIESNNPVLVVQYAVGREVDGFGDPFMMNLPPIEQFNNNYAIVVPSEFSVNVITVLVPPEYYQPLKVFVDEKSQIEAQWTSIPCTYQGICGYAAYISVNAGSHSVYHDDTCAKIGVQVYGFNRYTGYGYPAVGALPLPSTQAPGSVSVSDVESTSVRVSWQAVENADRYTVTLSQTMGDDQLGLCREDSRTVSVDTSSLSVVVGQTDDDMLRAYTTYSITVVAESDVWKCSKSSDPIAVTTTQTNAQVAPHNVRAMVVSSTVISVQWDGLSPCSQVNGLIVEYRVQYTAESSGVVQSIDQTGEWNVTGAEASLIGLTPYTNYFIQVAAVNEQGDVGLYSDPIRGQTAEDVPGPVVVTPHPSLLEISISWSPPDMPNGVIIAYEVSYRPTDSSQPVTRLNTTDLATSFTTQSDLEVGTEFIFSVRAYTRVGPGNASYDIVSILHRPPAVQGVKLSSMNSAEVHISWDALIIDVPIEYYTVVYSPLSTGQHHRDVGEMSAVFVSPATSGVITISDATGSYQVQVFSTVTLNDVLLHGERSLPFYFTYVYWESETDASTGNVSIIIGVVTAVIGVVVGITGILISCVITKRSVKHGRAVLGTQDNVAYGVNQSLPSQEEIVYEKIY